jgi:hypothetical protein
MSKDAHFNSLVDLDPGTATHAAKHFDCVAFGVVLGRLILSFDLNSDDSVKVKATIRCYRSPKPETDDYDEASQVNVLKAGQSGTFLIGVQGFNDAWAVYSLRNETNQS